MGVRHLGFIVPFYITQQQGQRWRAPSRGVCSECGEQRERVFIRWDDSTYCSDCLMYDLAEADPSDEVKREQKHPAPRESMSWSARERGEPCLFEVTYDRVSAVLRDDFDSRVWAEVQ